MKATSIFSFVHSLVKDIQRRGGLWLLQQGIQATQYTLSAASYELSQKSYYLKFYFIPKILIF